MKDPSTRLHSAAGQSGGAGESSGDRAMIRAQSGALPSQMSIFCEVPSGRRPSFLTRHFSSRKLGEYTIRREKACHAALRKKEGSLRNSWGEMRRHGSSADGDPVICMLTNVDETLSTSATVAPCAAKKVLYTTWSA